MPQKHLQYIMCVAAFVTVLGGTGALAQQNQPAVTQPAPVPAASNPFRAVTDFMGLTTEAARRPISSARPGPTRIKWIIRI